jgi:prepilin-type N-terminal cleavage/methylation domain-containing protein
MPRTSSPWTARKRAPGRRAQAFTLIELLVVIGIIAILLALLMPSLTGMREKAQRMRCMSNVRQMVLAAMHYAGDHSGALPYPNWNNAVGALPDCPPGWAFDAHKPVTTCTNGALWPYLRDQAVYRCPSDKAASTPGVSPNLKLTSYVMNGFTGGLGGAGSPNYAFNYTQFKPTDVMFWEGSTASMTSSGDLSSTPNEGMTFRHNKTGAFACFDGHSEYISSVDYTAKVIKFSGRSQFWCNPRTANGH